MNDVVLTVDDLHLRRGPRAVLAGVSLSVARGELVAIMGPSGSGKTTVLRAIAGLEPYERGHVAVGGVKVGLHDRLRRVRVRAWRLSVRSKLLCC